MSRHLSKSVSMDPTTHRWRWVHQLRHEILFFGKNTMDKLGSRGASGQRRRRISCRRHPPPGQPSLFLICSLENSAVIPRSLKLPVCELPHCDHKSFIPGTLVYLRPNSSVPRTETISSSSTPQDPLFWTKRPDVYIVVWSIRSSNNVFSILCRGRDEKGTDTVSLARFVGGRPNISR